MYLDHIVHVVTKKPNEVAEEWKSKGFHAVVGGQHTHWGTYNALLYTKNSYIEWLSLEHEEIAKNSDHPLVNLLLHDLKTGPGFGTICIRTKTIDDLCHQLKSKGIVTSGVLHAERKTTSGIVRKWKMLFVQELVSEELPTPFFIEWEENDKERYQILQQEGTIEDSNLEMTISKCEFHVRHPREVMDKWKSYFNLEQLNECTLALSNTDLVFTMLENGEKERLACIYVNGSGKKEQHIYERAIYCFR